MTAWKFWPLVHCITYGVIPARHRILWVNCVDLVWNAILASMSTSKQNEQEVPDDESLLETAMAAEPIVLRQDLVSSPHEGLFNATSTPESAL